MAGSDAGLELACPRCGQLVRQKAMIPISSAPPAVDYVCVPCARTMVSVGAADATPPVEAEASAKH